MKRVDLFGKGFHMMAKPIGPVCNLNCRYCFYTEKQALFPGKKNFRMSDAILEAFIDKYINEQEIPEIQFVWQGGEPTLLGLDFFKKAVSFQQKYAGNKIIINSLQTNGTLLDDDWCRFLKKSGFMVGLSLDGPAALHDAWRVTKNGGPTHSMVLRGLSLLQKYDIPFNAMVSVTRESCERPLEIYRFLKDRGIRHIQFTPIVERVPDTEAAELGLKNAAPPLPDSVTTGTRVTPWSVGSEAYGDFLIRIFDEWVRNDVGSVFVMNFEWALEAWMGLPSTICIFAEQCGRAVVLEHNGDIYSCDHYVYPRYRIGNILTDGPGEVIASETQARFGREKEASLPKVCRECEVLFACHGECPRHRFMTSKDGEPGLSYLCAGYLKYFRHIHPYMKVMRQLIDNGRPADLVMKAIKGPLVIFND